jgi:hypothetical protein
MSLVAGLWIIVALLAVGIVGLWIDAWLTTTRLLEEIDRLDNRLDDLWHDCPCDKCGGA